MTGPLRSLVTTFLSLIPPPPAPRISLSKSFLLPPPPPTALGGPPIGGGGGPGGGGGGGGPGIFHGCEWSLKWKGMVTTHYILLIWFTTQWVPPKNVVTFDNCLFLIQFIMLFHMVASVWLFDSFFNYFLIGQNSSTANQNVLNETSN